MQIDVHDHFEAIVMPAAEAYQQAERDLTQAVVNEVSEPELVRARFAALRQGGAAALYLHHFADIVATRGTPRLPDFKDDVAATRRWLADLSRSLSGESDVELLGDVADALKHSVLTRHLPREVEEAGQVLTIARGFGTARFGDGKFGGMDEVWILGRSEPRSLNAILDSVIAVWLYAFENRWP